EPGTIATRLGQKSAAPSAGLPSVGPPPASVVMIAAGCAAATAGDSHRSSARPTRRRLMGDSLRDLGGSDQCSATLSSVSVATTHSQLFCVRDVGACSEVKRTISLQRYRRPVAQRWKMVVAHRLAREAAA